MNNIDILEEKEKEAIKDLEEYLHWEELQGFSMLPRDKHIETLLNLVSNLIAENKELKEENEGLKTKLDTLIEKYKELKEEKEELKRENLEIRDWKYVIDSPIDLDKLKELDLIKIKGKEYISKSIYNELEKDKKALINNYSKILGEFIPKDKIKAKIEEKIEWCIKASNSGLNAIQYACSKEDEIERIERQKNISTMISILEEMLQELLDERNNTDEH